MVGDSIELVAAGDCLVSLFFVDFVWSGGCFFFVGVFRGFFVEWWVI